MSVKTFAAIDVGSFEISLKIFEFSNKNSSKVVEHVRQRIALGTDTYTDGKISTEKLDELCRTLKEFSEIMKTYKVSAYKAYGTSSIREAANTRIIVDQIEQRTGIHIDTLSNSEQRFLDYKAIAFTGESFKEIIKEGTAIVDIGGGSIQISLFDKDVLVATQNLKLGVLRMQEWLNKLNVKSSQKESIIDEIASAQLNTFKKLYLKDSKIKTLILVDDYLSAWIVRRSKENGQSTVVNSEEYEKFLQMLRTTSTQDVAKKLGVSVEAAQLTGISAYLVKRILKLMEADKIWAPGVSLCDGIAYEYAEKNKILLCDHDFEKDIVACALNISKRYSGSRKRAETLEKITMTIFDSMKKVHGLGNRERLYLRIAAMLHDCGKFISMMDIGETSYHIIMATEMIGLSHMEREIVANIVRYNHSPFVYYENMGQNSLTNEAYLTMAKLAAILKIANGLDRSHKQKLKGVKAVLKDNQLILTIDTQEDILLEKGLFTKRARFFEEVFNIKPVIKQKRVL
ncbi:MAG: HD domain-containing protein [Lachnospiraceae bacterium]|nr:HD domain-containing protein [Lachnospiraceae bacterium]